MLKKVKINRIHPLTKLVTVAIAATTIVGCAKFAEKESNKIIKPAKITNNSAKTAKEWIDVLTEKTAEKRKSEDKSSLDYKIMIGGYLAGTKFVGSQMSKDETVQKRWDECFKTFKTFMKSKGDALFKQWLGKRSARVP